MFMGCTFKISIYEVERECQITFHQYAVFQKYKYSHVIDLGTYRKTQINPFIRGNTMKHLSRQILGQISSILSKILLGQGY